MILFELRCAQDHQFEGWFPSGAAYEAQLAKRELSCPLCGDRKIDKAVMAPRIGKAGEPTPPAEPTPATRMALNAKAALQELRKKIEANCDYVGPGFAEEARRIHYGEAEERGIYGEASDEQAQGLNDEGIAVARVPWVPRNDS
jgi:hypothetical protein